MIVIYLLALVGVAFGDYLEYATDDLEYATADSRIIDGQDAPPGVFPWQVSLQQYYDGYGYWHYCGGSIISKNFVLTAAHCDRGSLDFTVYAGSVDKFSGGVRLAVSQFIAHPEYNAAEISMDFALIELEDSIPRRNKNIRPIRITGPLFTENTQFWGYSVTSGWGYDFYNISGDPSLNTLPETLQAAKMYILTDQACSAIFGSFFQPSNMICAGYTGSAACMGDSGGPLVKYFGKWPVLIGVTSWAPTTCTLDYPYGWAKVSAVRQWILDNSDLQPWQLVQ